MQETWVWSLSQEDLLEEEMAIPCSVAAWRIPWTERPGGLQSMGSQRVRHDRATSTHTHKIPLLYLFRVSIPGYWASQVVLVVKNTSANAGDIRDTGSILGSGRSSEGGHGNPLQYSCLENPMDRGPWQATVLGVTKSQKWLKRLSMHTQREWLLFNLDACFLPSR